MQKDLAQILAVYRQPHRIPTSACANQFEPTLNVTEGIHTWRTTVSSKVNLPRAIKLGAVCGANLVTYPPEVRRVKALEIHRVANRLLLILDLYHMLSRI